MRITYPARRSHPVITLGQTERALWQAETADARDVDGGPRDDTRAVALRERASAYDYLAFVERTPSPAFVAALGEETVASQLAEIPSLRAGLTPPPPRFPAPWAVG